MTNFSDIKNRQRGVPVGIRYHTLSRSALCAARLQTSILVIAGASDSGDALYEIEHALRGYPLLVHHGVDDSRCLRLAESFVAKKGCALLVSSGGIFLLYVAVFIGGPSGNQPLHVNQWVNWLSPRLLPTMSTSSAGARAPSHPRVRVDTAVAPRRATSSDAHVTLSRLSRTLFGVQSRATAGRSHPALPLQPAR